MSPFSREVGEQYTRELARMLSRCKLNEAAKKFEIREYAKLMVAIYRKEMAQDWAPSKKEHSK